MAVQQGFTMRYLTMFIGRKYTEGTNILFTINLVLGKQISRLQEPSF